MRDSDNVNHPNHYNAGGIEVIEMMRRIWGDRAVAQFCDMNAFKYRMRAGLKENQLEDLKKAEWYEDYKKQLEASYEGLHKDVEQKSGTKDENIMGWPSYSDSTADIHSGYWNSDV